VFDVCDQAKMASKAPRWHFNIDKYLNPIVPPSPLPKLPYPLAHFLGHRTGPPRQLGNLIVVSWAFLGVLCGISLVEVVNAQIGFFKDIGAPPIIGSFVRLQQRMTSGG
jgi:hypothetical protein